MSLVRDVLAEIDAYTKRRGIAESTFGRLAVDDGKFVGRLRTGKGVTVRILERARQYMAENPPDDQPPADVPQRRSARVAASR
jgi:hypothetical protein